MGLFGIFGRHDKGDLSDVGQVTVVYVMGGDQLLPVDAQALHDRIAAAAPQSFEVYSPSSFFAFFPGTEEGKRAGTALAQELRRFARERSIHPFGISIRPGRWMSSFASHGRLSARLTNETLDEAFNSALADAASGGA